MIIRLARVLYWLAAAVSVLLIVVLAASVLFSRGEARIEMQILVGVAAILIWLSGRAVLYVFADR